MSKNLELKEVISRLMHEKKLTIAALARKVNLPQPTVHRIVKGTSTNPHGASLKALSKFFGLSIEQLKGLEPINWLAKTHPQSLPPGCKAVPVISWESSHEWPKLDTKSRAPFSVESLLLNPPKDGNAHSKNLFALKVRDRSMAPLFDAGSILFIDPDMKPDDRSYVLAKVKGAKAPVFRQIIFDSANQYLKPLNEDLKHRPLQALQPEDEILGALVCSYQHH